MTDQKSADDELREAFRVFYRELPAPRFDRLWHNASVLATRSRLDRRRQRAALATTMALLIVVTFALFLDQVQHRRQRLASQLDDNWRSYTDSLLVDASIDWSTPTDLLLDLESDSLLSPAPE